MEIVESKLELIRWISGIEDPMLIHRLEQIKDSKVDFWDELTVFEQESIEIGMDDIANNRVVNQSEMDQIFDKWK